MWSTAARRWQRLGWLRDGGKTRPSDAEGPKTVIFVLTGNGNWGNVDVARENLPRDLPVGTMSAVVRDVFGKDDFEWLRPRTEHPVEAILTDPSYPEGRHLTIGDSP
jgi:hypothetical protein